MNGSTKDKMVNFIRACEGGGACVETARLKTTVRDPKDPDGPKLVLEIVLVRDSKNPDGPVLVFSMTEWREFIRGAKRGEFDFDTD